ncbi:hypothetical protein [Paenibacillus sp. UMB4589-SE434]|uniref:hypothetical protein n=1 Tax=Paenibacillus sp. UMB4589-SE434 TaxID=3046314 RepID=UPI00254D5607|nr:hypothetical protein [Paenibacillus sp. UMB4589-SE434]MDK8183473.1 hypothetical protein [Paenibacillus sp. UMB4589-SE434]
MRSYIFLLLGLFLLFGAIVYITVKDATSERPEQTALMDYVWNMQSDKENLSTAASKLTLSRFSLAIDDTLTADRIYSYKGNRISELLRPTGERLWFAMNEQAPEGIIIANVKEPVRMGGKYRSLDLFHLYNKVRATVETDEQIRYFEFEGQSMLAACLPDREDIYLTASAAMLLDLPAGQKIPAEQVIEKMKEWINQR